MWGTQSLSVSVPGGPVRVSSSTELVKAVWIPRSGRLGGGREKKEEDPSRKRPPGCRGPPMKMAWSNLRGENPGPRIYKRIREGFDRKEKEAPGRSNPAGSGSLASRPGVLRRSNQTASKSGRGRRGVRARHRSLRWCVCVRVWVMRAERRIEGKTRIRRSPWVPRMERPVVKGTGSPIDGPGLAVFGSLLRRSEG